MTDKTDTAGSAGDTDRPAPKPGATLYSSHHRLLNHEPPTGWPDEVPPAPAGAEASTRANAGATLPVSSARTASAAPTTAAPATPAASTSAASTSAASAGTAGPSTVASK